jgi:tRNA(Ile)-lysidine synthase TilS/MesJ
MIDVVLAWSGGKDSTLALAALRADPRYRVGASHHRHPRVRPH